MFVVEKELLARRKNKLALAIGAHQVPVDKLSFHLLTILRKRLVSAGWWVSWSGAVARGILTANLPERVIRSSSLSLPRVRGLTVRVCRLYPGPVNGTAF